MSILPYKKSKNYLVSTLFMGYDLYCKENRGNKKTLIRKIKSCKEERCVEYEKICKNDV